MNRLSPVALIIMGVLLVGAVLYIGLFKPVKSEMRIYRIGEQGLWEERDLRHRKMSQIVVTQVGGYHVTASEAEQAVLQLPPFQRFYYSSPEKVTIFLQNYALLLVLSSQAWHHGLAGDAHVRYVLEDRLAQAYRKAYLAERVKPSDITAAQVEDYLRLQGIAQDSSTAAQDGEPATAAKAAILAARRG